MWRPLLSSWLSSSIWSAGIDVVTSPEYTEILTNLKNTGVLADTLWFGANILTKLDHTCQNLVMGTALNPSKTGEVKITNSPVDVFGEHKLPFTDINGPVHSFQSISPYSGGIFKIPTGWGAGWFAAAGTGATLLEVASTVGWGTDTSYSDASLRRVNTTSFEVRLACRDGGHLSHCGKECKEEEGCGELHPYSSADEVPKKERNSADSGGKAQPDVSRGQSMVHQILVEMMAIRHLSIRVITVYAVHTASIGTSPEPL
ncbi:hypothetical protein DFH08DRAFT_801965 [Mycena albidolilacea]|uniref:Uncharacterized protein n=1 Tax=Mycena albidolilacea TaxID=1033008 RepID=A0AAD7AGI0_9AGAR|nr:hypothetical protein DFH08DRAFT_801965 [Mycena albidolilacea]